MVHEDNPPVTSVCFAPNGRYVLAFSMDSCLRLWDYVSGSVKKTYQGHANKAFSVGGCFGSVDAGRSAFIAAASEDGDVVLWDVKTKEVVQRIERAHDGVCFWVDVNRDTMVTCGQDGRIKILRHQGPEGMLSNGVNGVGAIHDAVKDEPMADADVGDSTPAMNEDQDKSNETPAQDVEIKDED